MATLVSFGGMPGLGIPYTKLNISEKNIFSAGRFLRTNIFGWVKKSPAGPLFFEGGGWVFFRNTLVFFREFFY